MRKTRLLTALVWLCLPFGVSAAPGNTASAPTMAPVALPPSTATWRLRAGAPLRDVLYDWSRRAGWTLVWDSEYQYTLDADAQFSGDFPAAVTQLFHALGDLNPPLYPALYQGNRVLAVKALPSH
jgi:hypothetical protein